MTFRRIPDKSGHTGESPAIVQQGRIGSTRTAPTVCTKPFVWAWLPDLPRRILIVPVRRSRLLGVIALVMAGACSGGEAADQSVPAPPSNTADVRFLQDVLGHEERALRLAELAVERVPGKEILGFAESVLSDRREQVPYVRNLLRFIGSSPDPAAPADPGVTPADIDRLREASGPEAQRIFLELLVRLDQATAGFAKVEMADGLFADAKTHAETLLAARQTELATARRLLLGSGASSG